MLDDAETRSEAKALRHALPALVLLATLETGCVSVYSSVGAAPSATAPGASVSMSHTVFAERASTGRAPSVFFVGEYRSAQGVVLGLPRLAPRTSRPCTGGPEATAFSVVRSEPEPRTPGDVSRVDGEGAPANGEIVAGFERSSVDHDGLLRMPTVLDIPLLHPDGTPPACLRLEVVRDGAAPQWERAPMLSLGYGFRLGIPVDRIYDVSALPQFMLRVGPWLGPVRLRAEIGIGGAAATARNPNLVGYSYAGGIAADVLLFDVRRFGLGLGVGYDVTSINFGSNVKAYSQEGTGYRGLIHGPRAGLSFALLPEPPVGPAFAARRNSASGSIELYVAPEWSSDRSSATPAVFLVFAADGGL